MRGLPLLVLSLMILAPAAKSSPATTTHATIGPAMTTGATAGPASDNLNGIWKGTLTQGPGGCYPQYSLELQINFTDDRITGKAYDFYDKAHYVKMSFTGRYNA